MKIQASAPGKMVLLGEYAVLEGAPALVMAVNRRATAEVTTDVALWRIDAPDVWSQPVTFDLGADGAPVWRDPAPGLPEAMSLIGQILHGLAGHDLLPRMPIAMRLDSSAFFQGRGPDRAKLGLGSSAAVTVALTAALASAAGHPQRVDDRARWLHALLSIHRQFQGGRGSGLDLAAAIHGGVIGYRLQVGMPTVEPLRWPPALHRIWVWSGRSASTAGFLRCLDGWRRECPRAFARHMAALTAIAESGRAALIACDHARLMACLAETGRALQHFGEASKIPIFSAEHRQIAKIVGQAGGVYKPCGAGGGDLGLAVTGEASVAARIGAALRTRGLAVLDLDVDDAGLVVNQVVDQR